MKNEIQPLGFVVNHWSPPSRPVRENMSGIYCRLEPLAVEKHATELFDAYTLDEEGRLWTYLPYGPFATFHEYKSWLENICAGSDPLFFAVIDTKSNRAVGVASYLRIDPANGSIEVGHLCYSPLMQKTVIATEAMFLMMGHVFELGYRRYEWKCNSLNEPSRKAAQRLGFSYEGTFRQAAVIKGRNRDTSWYSIIDTEWPALKTAYSAWLNPDNFAEGGQKIRLSDLTQSLLACCG